MNTMPDINVNDELRALLGETYTANPFEPLAYYDDELDCIRVMAKDCSYTAERLNETFTILKDNYPDSGQYHSYVGFTIKGLKHLFTEMNLPFEGVYKLVDILDAIVSNYPDDSMRGMATVLTSLVPDESLEVDMGVAA